MIRWILWSLAFGNQKGNNFAHRILKKVSLVQNRQCGGRRFEDNALVFWEKDRQALPSHHNQPLYVIAYVHDTELKSALIDPDSSLNIMLFSTHEALRIPRGRSLSNQSKSGLRKMHPPLLATSTLTLTTGPIRELLVPCHALRRMRHWGFPRQDDWAVNQSIRFKRYASSTFNYINLDFGYWAHASATDSISSILVSLKICY